MTRSYHIAWVLQVLVRLCKHTAPADELAKSDDIMLLFSAISSPCPAYNRMWRKSAAEVLMTLSRYGLTKNVVRYIHSECVSCPPTCKLKTFCDISV